MIDFTEHTGKTIKQIDIFQKYSTGAVIRSHACESFYFTPATVVRSGTLERNALFLLRLALALFIP